MAIKKFLCVSHRTNAIPVLDGKRWLRCAQKLGWSAARFVLLVGVGYIILYPLLYMLSRSFCSIQDVYDVTVKWIPKHFTAENFFRVFQGIQYPKALLNTVIVSVGSSVLLLMSCSLAAYGMSRFRFRGQGVIFILLLFTIVVPQQFFVLPSFLNFSYFNGFGLVPLINALIGANLRINLLDSFWVFLFPAILGIGIRSGLYIFIFIQFFKGLPKELEEAAYIDGCGFINTFVRIIIPSAVPVLVTVFLFSLVWHWNDYQLSSVLMPENRTLSGSLINLKNILYQMDATLGSSVAPDNNRIALDTQVANLLVVAPVVLLYTVAQRFFTESIERTGLVG